MADIRRVDGLDVRPGQLLRHGSGVIVKVTGAARKKQGGRIVNVVQVERTDNGQRGYLTLQQGQTFTVGRPGGDLTAPENQRENVSRWASGDPD